jgi:hypothetical protein
LFALQMRAEGLEVYSTKSQPRYYMQEGGQFDPPTAPCQAKRTPDKQRIESWVGPKSGLGILCSESSHQESKHISSPISRSVTITTNLPQSLHVKTTFLNHIVI